MDLDPLVIIRDELQPPNGNNWFTEKQQAGEPPLFTTREVALVYFGKGKKWLQRLILSDEDVSHLIQSIGMQVGNDGYRRIQLRQIEELAHILLEYGKISMNTFINAIRILKAMADNYGILTKETDGPIDSTYRRHRRHPRSN